MPLVSVVVPTYNRPEMLLEALKSILNQSYRNFEIIVVNDGGKDVSSVIAPYEGMGKITYIELDENKGPAATRNCGLQKARGKYVAYLDDDDIYLHKHIETLVSALETTSYQVAYTDAYAVTQESFGGQYRTVKTDVPFSEDFSRESLLVHNYIPILTLMHKKQLLQSIGVFDERLRILEDWEFFIRLSKTGDFYHIPERTCKFYTRVGDSSHVNSSLTRQMKAFVYIYDKHPADKRSILQGRIAMLKGLKEEATK